MLIFRKNWANSKKTYGHTEGQTEGQTEEKTDPILQEPSDRGQGSNKLLTNLINKNEPVCFQKK